MRFRRKSLKQTFVDPGDVRNNVGNTYIGVTIPFNNPNGIFFQSTTNINQVYSNLKNLLMTSKGERYMLPEFGTEIRYILFENITDEDNFVEAIKTDISNALKMWLPYLVIERLEVNINVQNDGRVDDPSHAVGIKLTVRIDKTQIYLPIKIFISVTGNITLEAIYDGTG